jgi:hypothetical protein
VASRAGRADAQVVGGGVTGLVVGATTGTVTAGGALVVVGSACSVVVVVELVVEIEVDGAGTMAGLAATSVVGGVGFPVPG